MAQLSLIDIKNLFKEGVKHCKKKYSSMFFDRDDDFLDYQTSLVEKAQDLNSVMNAIYLGNSCSTWASAFKKPNPVCDRCEISNTAVQYGQGHIGWYFFYGVTDDIVYNITFFRFEIAPPGLSNLHPSELARWMVLGGYGSISKKEWYTIPLDWLYLKYNPFEGTTHSYSTFQLSGSNNTFSNVLLETTQPMEFNLDISFTDTLQNKRRLTVLMNANTPPAAAAPNSCLMCVSDVGSMYYSYTDMNISVSAENESKQPGCGWIDHQTIKGGIPKSSYIQALMTVKNIITPKKSGGWLWIAIQDLESGTQYMLSHFFGNKYYGEDIKIGDNIPMSLINVYKKGVPYFKPQDDDTMDVSDLKVKLIETVPYHYDDNVTVNLPTKYTIILPGGKSTILSVCLPEAPNVYPISGAPYECPSILYDSTGKRTIGVGLIEANGYFTTDVYVKRILRQAGEDPNNRRAFDLVKGTIKRKQSLLQIMIAFIYVLFPLILLVILLLVAMCPCDKAEKKTRIMIALVVFIVITSVFYSYTLNY